MCWPLHYLNEARRAEGDTNPYTQEGPGINPCASVVRTVLERVLSLLLPPLRWVSISVQRIQQGEFRKPSHWGPE